jgi:ribonuclease BN (tRNA processing enzyme)
MNNDNDWCYVDKSIENKLDKILEQINFLNKKVEVLTHEVSRLKELDIRETNFKTQRDYFAVAKFFNVRRGIPFHFTPQYTGVSSTYLKTRGGF